MKLNGFGLAVLAASEAGYTPEIMQTNNIDPETRKQAAKPPTGDYAAKREQSALRRADRARKNLQRIPDDNRGDTAEINIPWDQSRGRKLEAAINRELRRQELEQQLRHSESRAAYWAGKKKAS